MDEWMLAFLGLMVPSLAVGSRDASFLFHADSARALDSLLARAKRQQHEACSTPAALVLFLALATLPPSLSPLSHPRSGRETVGIVSHASCVLPPPPAAA